MKKAKGSQKRKPCKYLFFPSYQLAGESRMLDQSMLQSFFNNTWINAGFASHNRNNMAVKIRCLKQQSCWAQMLFINVHR